MANLTTALPYWKAFIDSLEQGVPKLWDLIPDDLRWSWCNKNRNKVHNKYNVPESSWNQLPPCCGKIVFHKTGAWCQKGWRPLPRTYKIKPKWLRPTRVIFSKPAPPSWLTSYAPITLNYEWFPQPLTEPGCTLSEVVPSVGILIPASWERRLSFLQGCRMSPHQRHQVLRLCRYD